MIVNMHDAKTHLSRLVERAASGEEVIIGKAGKPMARLIAYTESTGQRRPGRWKGRVKIAKDFDDTPTEVLEAFERG